MAEVESAEQVEAKQTEDDDPEGEECLAVEDMPAVGEIGYRKEFQRQSQFEEAEKTFMVFIQPPERGER